jgi:1-acyl-sn-glycerol-3-phosphate acyltransferase
MTFLRSLAFNLYFYLFTASWLIIMLPTAWGSKTEVMALVKRWARINRWAMTAIAGIEVEIRGREYIPTSGAIIASKHQSTFETVALLDLFADPTFVLKQELLAIPLFGRYARRGEQIAVDRSAGRAALLKMTRQARAEAAKGRQIIIYPEGTRRPAGAPPDYKHGLVHLYRALAVPMVPVALNAGLFWGRHRFLRHPGRLIVEFLPPIPPGLDPETAFEAVRDAIEAATDRLIGEALAGPNPPPLPPEGRAFLERRPGIADGGRS